MKHPLAFSGSFVLGCIALLAPLHARNATLNPLTLAQQANEVLGLSHSIISEVRVVSVSGERIRVGVDLPGAPIVLDLEPYSVRAASFEARAQLDDGSWVVLPPEPVRTYRGTIASDPGSVVVASMLDEGLHARLRLSDGEEFWVEPLVEHMPGMDAGAHVVYATESVNDIGANCDASRLEAVDPPGLRLRDESSQGSNAGSYAGGPVTAEIACDADFEYFSTWGGNTQARIESVIAGINLQYSSEVGITHEITTILIRTSSNDPYTKTKADQLLNEFRNEWNSNQAGVQRDLAHLFTGKNLSGTTIGIAYISQVCNLSLAYGLVESDFASNFACVTDLSAHEIGHNWGADHCNCSGFTMNASITCANTFSPSATIPDIIAFRDSQSCFGAPPATGNVSGTVTSSAGGAPIGGATVQVDSGQSATTAGNGSYTISGVPTGSRIVTASAPGFQAANQGVNVNENQTATANFSLDPAPAGSQVVVDCITYRSSGGGNQDRNLFIDVTVVDDLGAPVSGASIAVSVDLDGAPFGTASATSGSDGQVTFQAKNSPNGCYVTDVTSVSAAGLTFDGTDPLNGFAKGTEQGPDPDCRSGSDGCP